jgi:2-C-methyl-D-erythritol 4-phosphate cytidylyltransferase/2-C-methyl-D-erythritol 2,4-cyclodiphosphate synthase
MKDDTNPTIAVVIVAAGRGTRVGGGLAKQWREVAGRSVADWAARAFASHPRIDCITLVVPDQASSTHWPEVEHHDCRLVEGGPSRAASVFNGLSAIYDQFDKVLIHDVARPMISHEVIDRVIDALETSQGAAPAIAVTDALWHGSNGAVSGTQDRDGLFRAQTPQGFDLDAIYSAHESFEGEAADDVEIARAAGLQIAIVEGSEDNLKITTEADFDRAARLLGEQDMSLDIRTGNGFDVHRFGSGDHVMLCGVPIAHTRGLQGHSDADVALHTVTDAIYGALAEGDIGQHFPPSDPQWKGAESHIFLTHARDLAATKGYAITHVDCTLICEMPKIGPHALEMRGKLSELLEISLDRISVKATTSEKLGFTGRGEGIACMATVTLLKS